jgi:glycosyltransferase involved in cell wall biosynthesis
MVTAKSNSRITTEKLDGIRVIRIPVSKYDPSKWISFGYLAENFLIQLCRKENFDAIHFLDAHVAFNFRGSFVATLHQSFNQRMHGDHGLPYHSSTLNLAQRYPYYLIARLLERKALNKCNAFISVSQATKKEFVQNYKINPSKIEVIYNGIDTSFFKYRNANWLKHQLGLADEKILLYVGFSTPRKGLETLAQALNLLKETNLKLVMVGKWEKGYREKFYNAVGKNKPRIIEAGYVPDQDMPQYYCLADVFVLPSLLEGFGFPLVEAMACGTPIISTDVGAIPEVVGDCGIIVPPKDSRQLAQSIDRLIKDDALRENYKRKSRQRVCDNFSEQAMVAKTLNVYQKVNAQILS